MTIPLFRILGFLSLAAALVILYRADWRVAVAGMLIWLAYGFNGAANEMRLARFNRQLAAELDKAKKTLDGGLADREARRSRNG